MEEWYAGELEDDGWRIERQATQNQGATIIATKGRETLLVLIAGASSGDGPVNILLTYTESPAR